MKIFVLCCVYNPSISMVCCFQGCENGITLIADNPFISKKELIPFEKGIRIDYILFKVGEGSAWLFSFCNFQGLESSDTFNSSHFAIPGSPQDRHLLRFHVHHQRIRSWPSIPVLWSWGSHCSAATEVQRSSWGWRWQTTNGSRLSCRYLTAGA